jgi:cellulose synthase (UDP-forming)
VYEVLFAELPRLFARLTARQRLAYGAIATYYLVGATTPVYLLVPYVYLWTGLQPAAMPFAEFLTRVLPVAALGGGLYLFAQRWLCHPAVESGLHWRGMVLKAACWPVFLLGTILAVVRAEVPYVPTAKEAVKGRFLRLAWPHVCLLALYLVTVGHVALRRLAWTPAERLGLDSEAVWGMVAFATLPVFAALGALYAAWAAGRPAPGVPWEQIDVDRLGGWS